MYTTSIDGRHWSETIRIPIDPLGSEVDHFLPALAVDPTTSGAAVHIAVLYYYYPEYDCDAMTCELLVGLVSSMDGGSTWTPQRIAGPFRNIWFPRRTDGYFPGDYFSVSFVNGQAIAVFTAAKEGTCKLGKVACHTWISSATVSFAEGAP